MREQDNWMAIEGRVGLRRAFPIEPHHERNICTNRMKVKQTATRLLEQSNANDGILGCTTQCIGSNQMLETSRSGIQAMVRRSIEPGRAARARIIVPLAAQLAAVFRCDRDTDVRRAGRELLKLAAIDASNRHRPLPLRYRSGGRCAPIVRNRGRPAGHERNLQDIANPRGNNVCSIGRFFPGANELGPQIIFESRSRTVISSATATAIRHGRSLPIDIYVRHFSGCTDRGTE